jgi:secondary thiamine-phosphate synthase enzyme
MINENADASVRKDLEYFLSQLAPDGAPHYQHDAEGPDDMPAHIRTLLMHTDLTVPISNGKLLLGTWQGVFLYEHRLQGNKRQLCVSCWD